MAEKVRNLFISHVHEDDLAVKGLCDLLAKKNYSIRDGSITADKPNDAKKESYIKSQILAPGINWAGTLVITISPSTHLSKWVNWEIEHAAMKEKRIVGVWLQGAKDADLPDAFEKYGDALVGWNGDAIGDAIDGRINNWVTAEGKPREPRCITRYSCN